MPHIRTAVIATPLNVEAAIAEVSAPDCGAIGVFVGTVRVSAATGARSDVLALDYEAHPILAPQRLADWASWVGAGS